MPILREELRGLQPEDQYTAAKSLMLLGPDAADAVPDLVRLLNDREPGIRVIAAEVLGSIGRAARPAVPKLKEMLNEVKLEMRLRAAPSAVPKLAEMLKEDKLEMRLVVVADALSRIDTDVSEALAALRDTLVSQKLNEPFIGIAIELPDRKYVDTDPILESIARFGEKAAPLLAELLDNIDFDDWSGGNVSAQCGSHLRIKAAQMLARLGPEAKSAVPALVRALKDKDPFVRDAAARRAGRIGSAAREAAPEFIALLETKNRFASGGGAWSGSRTDGFSKAASRFEYGSPYDFRSAGRAALLSRLTGFGYSYRTYNPFASIRPEHPYDPIIVLSRIDAEACTALPILSEMAKDPNHPGRLSAALGIWRSGRDCPDLIPAFEAASEANANSGGSLTPEIRECLAELNTQLKPTVRVMATWLKLRQSSSTEEDQLAVIEALGLQGLDAQDSVDLIRPMLQGDRWDAKRRVAAALALFRMGGDKALVFPVLRELLLGSEERSFVLLPD